MYVQYVMGTELASDREAMRVVGQATLILTPGAAEPKRMSETTDQPTAKHKSHDQCACETKLLVTYEHKTDPQLTTRLRIDTCSDYMYNYQN